MLTHIEAFADEYLVHHCLFQLRVQWKLGAETPEGMWRGAAVSDGTSAYFTSFCTHTVYLYHLNQRKWSELPPSPYRYCGLAIINKMLTTVGGWDGFACTSRLLSFRKGNWVELFPSMKAARSDPAVVKTSNRHFIIAIGGWDGDRGPNTGASHVWRTTMEVFSVQNCLWTALSNSPACSEIAAAVCGDDLFVIGVDNKCYSCSLKSLPTKSEPHTSKHLTWTTIQCPVYWTTPTTLGGQLVLVGGRRDGTASRTLYQLCRGGWICIGQMSCAKWMCLVATVTGDRVIVAGGCGSWHEVEVATVV